MDVGKEAGFNQTKFPQGRVRRKGSNAYVAKQDAKMVLGGESSGSSPRTLQVPESRQKMEGEISTARRVFGRQQ